MIRAVLFDLDGTLYDRDAAILQMAEEQFDAIRDLLPGIERDGFIERLIALDGHGYSRPRPFHHLLAESLGCTSDVGDRLEECFRARYPEKCRIPTESLSTLRTLRTNGVKLGMITNGPTEWQSRKIECMQIAPLFDAILISETEGIHKPDVRIFSRALERCDVLPSEAVFVGDHPENDIAGARAAGLRVVWKRMPYWDVPEDVPKIDELSELLSLFVFPSP